MAERKAEEREMADRREIGTDVGQIGPEMGTTPELTIQMPKRTR